MGTHISAWYIIFVKRENTFWWDYVFSRGKHLAALGYDVKNEQWYFYDWNFLGLSFYKLTDEEVDRFVLHIQHTGGEILRALPPSPNYRQTFFPFATCVSSIKHLVKFKSMAFTPTQLFCAYTKAGAVRSFVSSDTSDGDRNECSHRYI